jgi:hypothetical protein
MKARIATYLSLMLALLLVLPLWGQEVKRTRLAPAEPQQGEGFGFAVAAEGNQLVVSSRFSPHAYIFKYDGTAWQQAAELKGANALVPASAARGFGTTLDLSGTYLAAGVPKAPAGTDKNVGLVEVFAKTDDGWAPVAALRAPTPAAKASFGSAIDLHQDQLIVGAQDFEYETGQAFLFTRTGSDWQGIALTDPNPRPMSRFGGSVAVRGDLALVGAPGLEDKRKTIGTCYLYTRDEAGNWNLAQTIAGDSKTQDVGQSLVITDNMLFIGAYEMILVYENVDGVWTETSRIFNPDEGAAMRFGASLQATSDGQHLLAGSSGKAYLFTRIDGAWKLVGSFVDDASEFATSNALTDDFFFLNSPFEGEEYINGAIYSYPLAPALQSLIN